MAEWRKVKGFDQEELARRIEKTRTGSGGISGFEHFEHAVLLNGMLEINDTIPESEKQKILNKATFAIGSTGTVTPDSILREVKSLEADYLKQPQRQFILLSGISVHDGWKLKGCRLDTCGITFGKYPGPKARQARQGMLPEARCSILADYPNNYLPLAVRVSAQSPDAAGEIALDGIDLVRGLWNLRLNRGQSWRWSSGRPKPINKIFLSPIHTLHNPDGSLASGTWWYDQGYKGAMDCLSNGDEIERMLAFGAHARRCLRKHHYSEHVMNAVIRYGRALDSDDFNDVFLRLWGLLEYLTASVSSPASVAIKRAAFLFAERDNSCQTLAYLADHRNRFVHTGSESNEIESLVFLLKRHVETLLLFHVNNHFNFISLHEAAEFMDLPASQSELTKRIEKLKLAKKFVTAS